MALAALACVVFSGRATAADRALLETIKHKELAAAVAREAVVVIQVGDKGEASGHLPGALSSSDVADDPSVLPEDKAALVVVYCSGKGRAQLPDVIARLKALGRTNIKRYSGGPRGWTDNGGALDEGEPKKPKKPKKPENPKSDKPDTKKAK